MNIKWGPRRESPLVANEYNHYSQIGNTLTDFFISIISQKRGCHTNYLKPLFGSRDLLPENNAVSHGNENYNAREEGNEDWTKQAVMCEETSIKVMGRRQWRRVKIRSWSSASKCRLLPVLFPRLTEQAREVPCSIVWIWYPVHVLLQQPLSTWGHLTACIAM